MTSGIYKLSFKDQLFYIGQSQDIETRWKQHRDKFLKGKAAEKMQAAYDHYGMPMGEILVQCHKDYLDLMENYLIHLAKQHRGCLNTSAPTPDPTVNYDFLLDNIGLIQSSAVDSIQLLLEALREKDALNDQIKELKQDNQTILNSYSLDMMQVRAEVELREGKDENEEFVIYYEKELDKCQAELAKTKAKVKRLLNRDWFDRLFNRQ